MNFAAGSADPSLPPFVWFLLLVPLALGILWGLICLPMLRHRKGDEL